MIINISLRQSWTALILMAVIVPTITLMTWFGYQLYTTKLNSALQIEQKKNEFLRDQIGLKLKLVKMVLHNRVKPLALIVNKQESQNIRKEINRNLSFILERELFVREIMIFSTEGAVIAVIDPNIGITQEKLLSLSNMQAIKQHYGFNSHNKPPELIIPSLGRDYISSPKIHDGFMGFKMAIPIGDPVKAIMVSVIDIEKLWSHKQNKESKALSTLIRDYLLDGRGALITTINDSDYKVGDLMTHLEVARKALINAPWQSKKSYIGINGQHVFGTITTIPILNWTLVSEVISAEITHPIWLELIKVFALVFFGLVLFIVLILYLAKKTIQPIQAICNATHQVTLGDYKIALKQCGIKELDVLAADFNLMAKSRQKAEGKLMLSDRVFRETHDGIIITDKNGIIIDVNPTFSSITGYSHAEVIGQNTSILRSYNHSAEFYQTMQQAITEQGHWQGEIWNRKKNGELYAELLTISTLKNDDSDFLYYVGIFSDITINKRQQEKLELMAHYDVLTNLPNRALFTDRFQQAIAHSKRTNSLLAVCFLDVDDFKPINDDFDHKTGDLLLVEVAERIKSCIRGEDTVSRQGGDEFTVLLGDLKSYKQCEKTLARMQNLLAQSYLIEGNQHKVTMSIGVTMYPNDDSDIDTLIRHADQAMYQAKQSGRNRYHFFNMEQDQKIVHKHHRIEKIQQALVNHEFCLYYQPKVNMKTGEVFGVEALIRWQHPEEGIIYPLDFLPIIENTGVEIKLGNWVINEALTQLSTWQAQGVKLEVSVNISSHHLQSTTFISDLEQVLLEHPTVETNDFQLEILESSVLSNLDAIKQVVKTCRQVLGINIALDDFGTGYSSLTHLRNLSANTIKIDQTFVRDMLVDSNDYAIIKGIIGLADSFNREIIAEGVEKSAHGLMLLAMGCEKAQGYCIAKPIPANEVENWLANYKPNQQWIDYGGKNQTLKESKLTLFKVAFSYWHRCFQDKMKLLPDSCWPIMHQNHCFCSYWIERSREEGIFEQKWLDKLDKVYDNYQFLAKKLHTKYQNNDSKSTRSDLELIQKMYEKIIQDF